MAMRRIIGAHICLTMLFCCSAAISGARAQKCVTDETAIVFPTISPLKLGIVGKRDAETVKSVEFGEVFSLVDRDAEFIRVCHEGQIWVSSAAQFVDGRKAWVKLDKRLYLESRPMLLFWRDDAKLQDFLVKKNGADVGPIYREVLGEEAAHSYLFPLVDLRTTTPLREGARAVQLAQVLVPISVAAVEEYQRFRSARDANPTPILLVDQSGSARAFLDQIMGELARELATSRGITEAEVQLIRFDGESDLRSRNRHVSDLFLLDKEDMVAGTSKATGNAVGSAINRMLPGLLSNGTQPPFLALAGGDIDLSNLEVDVLQHVYAFQITPEVDDELQNSVQSLEEGKGTFFAFSPAISTQIAELLGGLEYFSNYTDAPDVEEAIAEIQQKSGFLPLVPQDGDASELIPSDRLMPSADWITMPLWIVINRQLLDIVD